MGLEPGQVLDGKYRIAKLIGEGGMGAVFEGVNTFINRKVAIKVLHAASAGNEQVLRRFEREAQAAGTIGSDHILEVIDLGSLPGGDRYMVMEFLEGEELSTRIERKGRLSPEELCPILRQTLVGLKAAHAAQIIHRDLKPENIFVLREKAGQKDFVKIIDFGISKFNALGGDMSMTTTGAVMGTPYYMSPEQAKGMAHVDARTDIYAVGVIMYQALTGSVPFDGTSFNELMFKIVLAEPPELDDRVPEGFRAIVMKAMARDTGDRYQTADEFIAALDQYMADGTALGSEAYEQRELSNTVPGGRANKVSATLDGGVSAAQTDGNFAHTRGEQADPALPTRKSQLPLILAGAAMVLVAGVAFALRGGNSEEVEVSAAVIPVHEDTKPTPAEAAPEPAEQDKPSPPPAEEEHHPEPAQPQSTQALAPTQGTTTSTAPKATAPTPKPATAPKPKPATAPKPAAAAQPKPATTPKPATAPKPASSSRDFGY